MEKDQRIPPFHELKRKEIIEYFNHCAICGSRVHFTYQPLGNGDRVHETSTCPECKISFRVMEHIIQ